MAAAVHRTAASPDRLRKTLPWFSSRARRLSPLRCPWAGRGMSGLVNVSCSRASAEQRAGRAARQGPGRVVRCYDQKTYGAAPAHPTPEIAVADLTGAALVLACWGSPGGRGLSGRRPD